MEVTLHRMNADNPLTPTDYNQDQATIEAAFAAITVTGANGTVTQVTVPQVIADLFTAIVDTNTTTPAIKFTAVSKAPNLVYASPVSGSDAAPTFRALVSNDLPVVQPAKGGIGLNSLSGAYKILRINGGANAYEQIDLAPASSKVTITPNAGNFAFDVVPAEIEISTLKATTPLGITKGGTGGASAQTAINVLTGVAGATIGWVLRKNVSGDAVFEEFVIADATASVKGLLIPTDYNTFNNKLKSLNSETVGGATDNSILYIGGTGKLQQDTTNLTYDPSTQTFSTKNVTTIGVVINTNTRTETATYSISSGDYEVLFNNASSADATLPTDAAIGQRFKIQRIKVGGAAVVLKTAGAQKVNNVTSITLTTDFDVIIVKYAGSDLWYVESKIIGG